MSFLSVPNATLTRSDAAPFELGVSSFAELTPDPLTGKTVSPAERLKDLLEEIELADQVGLDVYGLGEHHRPDFVASAPAVILAAAAARTTQIRLSSAVTVLSSDDPVRVFQQFATLDLLSGGRAEIIAGRGSFIESFPLFGYDLQDYDLENPDLKNYGLKNYGPSDQSVLDRGARDGPAGAAQRAFFGELRRAATPGRPGTFEHFAPALGGWLEARVYPAAEGFAVFVRDVNVPKEAERRAAAQAGFRRDLLAFVQATLEDGLDESFYQRLLDVAVETIPGAQTGSLIVASVDDDTIDPIPTSPTAPIVTSPPTTQAPATTVAPTEGTG